MSVKSTQTIVRTYFLIALIIVSIKAQAQGLKAAIERFNNKEYDKAKTMLKAINKQSADYPEALFYLGRIAFDNKAYDDAVDFFEEAIDENETIGKYYTWYGNALGTLTQSASKIRQGILAPKIKNAYKKAAELDPKDLDAQWGLVEYYSQAPGFMGGSWEEAIKTANNIQAFNKLEGHRAKATIYQRQENWELTEKEFIILSELDVRYLINLGLFYQNRGNFDKSSEAFEKDLKINPDAWGSIYQIGKNSALSGTNTERGIAALKLYLEADRGANLPTASGANARLGMIYEKLGQKEIARNHYQLALQQDPKMELAKEGLERLK